MTATTRRSERKQESKAGQVQYGRCDIEQPRETRERKGKMTGVELRHKRRDGKAEI
jgi:hypothetical protein